MTMIKQLTQTMEIVSAKLNELHAVTNGTEKEMVKEIYNVLTINGLWIGSALKDDAISKVEEVTRKAIEVAKENPAPSLKDQIKLIEDEICFEEEEVYAEFGDLEMDEIDYLDDEDVELLDIEDDVTATPSSKQDEFLLPEVTTPVVDPVIAAPATPVIPATPEVPKQEEFNLAMKQIQLASAEEKIIELMSQHVKMATVLDIDRNGLWIMPNLRVIDADTSREQLYGDDRKDVSGNYVYGTTQRKPISTLLETGLYGEEAWKEINIMNSYLPMWIKTPAMHLYDILCGKQPYESGKQDIKEGIFGVDYKTSLPDAEGLLAMAREKAETYGVKINLESRSAVAIFLAHIYALNSTEFMKRNMWVNKMDLVLKKLESEGHADIVAEYLDLAKECIFAWLGFRPGSVNIKNRKRILFMILGISGATTKAQYNSLPRFLRGAI
jgi:hypothetical protein